MFTQLPNLLPQCRLLIPIRMKHKLPDLPYDYNALEPVISAEIMELHHKKHHQTYVNNLNEAKDKMQEAVSKGSVKSVVKLEPALRFNGGGHINHSIFWTNLCKESASGEPKGELLEQIKKDFGSVEKLQKLLSEKAIGIQGSGWAWLGFCKVHKRLHLATCPNQDPLEAVTSLIPLFGIDVWEHAYYLQYKNVRPDYVNAIWKIANWQNIDERYQAAQKQRH